MESGRKTKVESGRGKRQMPQVDPILGLGFSFNLDELDLLVPIIKHLIVADHLVGFIRRFCWA